MVDADAEELAIYDRQIRLWGLKAQKRMRKSNVLMVGTRGAASEIAKNLVLGGIGSFTILDEACVDDTLLESSFLLTADMVGDSAAMRLAASVQEYNPNVTVKGVNDDPRAMTVNALEDYNCVILCNQSLNTMLFYNKLTRERNIALFTCNSMGLTAFMFADLVKHEYLQIKTTSEGIEKKKPKEETWVSLSDMLDTPSEVWTKAYRKRSMRHIKTVLLNALVALKFSSLDDPNNVEATRIESFVKSKDPNFDITSTTLKHAFRLRDVDIAPTNAVVGGQVGQEVLNFLQGRHCPMRNIRAFDLTKSNTGTEVFIGKEVGQRSKPSMMSLECLD